MHIVKKCNRIPYICRYSIKENPSGKKNDIKTEIFQNKILLVLKRKRALHEVFSPATYVKICDDELKYIICKCRNSGQSVK